MRVVPAKLRSDLRDTAELIAEAGNLSRFRSADALASATTTAAPSTTAADARGNVTTKPSSPSHDAA